VLHEPGDASERPSGVGELTRLHVALAFDARLTAIDVARDAAPAAIERIRECVDLAPVLDALVAVCAPGRARERTSPEDTDRSTSLRVGAGVARTGVPTRTAVNRVREDVDALAGAEFEVRIITLTLALDAALPRQAGVSACTAVLWIISEIGLAAVTAGVVVAIPISLGAANIALRIAADGAVVLGDDAAVTGPCSSVDGGVAGVRHFTLRPARAAVILVDFDSRAAVPALREARRAPAGILPADLAILARVAARSAVLPVGFEVGLATVFEVPVAVTDAARTIAAALAVDTGEKPAYQASRIFQNAGVSTSAAIVEVGLEVRIALTWLVAARRVRGRTVVSVAHAGVIIGARA
jgi:hypothetical protein